MSKEDKNKELLAYCILLAEQGENILLLNKLKEIEL